MKVGFEVLCNSGGTGCSVTRAMCLVMEDSSFVWVWDL